LYKALIIFFALYINLPAQVTQEWVQRYNGTGNSFDIVSKLDIDLSGNIYVSGSSTGAGTLNDFLVIKYNSAGSQLWTARFNYIYNLSDALKASVIDSAGNVFAAGYASDSTGATSLIVIKIDSAGAYRWGRIPQFAGITASYAQSILLDKDGNLIITGTGRNAAGNYDIIVTKHAASGFEMWKKVYSSPGTANDQPVSAGIDMFNNIYITASSAAGTSASDVLLLKYNTSGDLQWVKAYGTPAYDDKPSALKVDLQNNILITAAGGALQSDYITIKYSPAGDTLWTRSYNGPGSSLDIPYAIALDNMDNIYITGSSRGGSTLGTEDITTIKYSSNGSILWARRFDGISNGTDIGASITVDGMQNVYIGGSTDTADFKMVYAALKYSAAGDFEWVKTYSISPDSPEDFIYDIKLDNSNNIFVTGISFGIGSDYDFATIKYSQTSGISSNNTKILDKYFLYQNYPNPFNPETRISFDITEQADVTLSVFNASGNQVKLLYNGSLKRGSYSVLFDASGFPSGIYFYRLASKNFSLSRKMIFVK
jgi:hypothetical protein